MKAFAQILTMAAAVMLTASTARPGFLLDNGSDGKSDGWTVSGTNQGFGGFSQFQSFAVGDAAGWSVTAVGIDGYFVLDPNSVGLTATIYPDVGGSPDVGNPLGSAVYFLTTDPFGGIDWRDEALNAFLPQGTYWVGAEANDPDYFGVWRSALMGDAAFTLRLDDQKEIGHEPVSLRIAGVVPAPGALGAMFVGLLVTARRRRR
jgi:hypothetical protein